eukprot:gene4440-7815_t
MINHHSILIFVIVLFSFVLCEEKVQNIPRPKPDGQTILFDDFEKDPFQNGWIPSKNSKFTGNWVWTTPKGELSSTEKGLSTSDEAKHYGISKVIQPPIDNTNTDLIIQYSVKFETSDGLSCGGSYIKLFEAENFTAENLSGETPYSIMFGPDRCGSNDKVHFIIRHQNPKSKKVEEKHLKNPPSIKNGQETNLYTLAIYQDNTYEIFINLDSIKKGSLLEDFEPPFTPSKQIDDPNDKKPSDWVDNAEMDDPESKKPDDWDESQPMEIVDPNDKKPDEWDESAPKKIPDPEAKKPEDWNDEEDGEWQPPVIENPQCKVGCGKFIPRTIKNPKYKGKWTPSKIKNPAYKGEWKPKKIPNPDYVEITNPHVVTKIGGVGIEIWTMTKNIIFDDFLITNKLSVATDYAKKSWKVISEKEKVTLESLKPQANALQEALINFKDAAIQFAFKYPVPLAATVIVLNLTLIFLLYLCCCGGSTESKNVRIEETKPEKETEEKEKEEKEKETKEEEKEETKEDVKPIEEQQDEVEEKEEKEEEEEKPKKRKGKKSNRL